MVNKKDISDNCIFTGNSLLVCFSNMPLGQEKETVSDIRKLFKEYNNSSKSADYKFNPFAFYLFGPFDCCTISIVDDFQFSSRTFRPYNVSMVEEDKQILTTPFYRQIHLGPIPLFNDTFSPENLFEKMESYVQKYPLFSLVQIKLNDIHLMTHGEKFIRYVILTIYKLIGEVNSGNVEEKKVDIVLSENSSWYEINLLCFSTSYYSVLNIVQLIRRIKKKDVFEKLNIAADHVAYLEHYDYFSEYGDESMNSLAVANTNTSLGFNINLFDDQPNSKELSTKIAKNELVFPHCLWQEKRHKYDLPVTWKNNLEWKNLDSFGRGDVLCLPNDREVPLKSFIEDIIALRSDKKYKEIFSNLHCSISIGKAIEQTDLSSTPRSIWLYKNYISTNTIPKDEITKFHQNLKKICTPKILSESLVNMFSVYNNGIKDELYFTNFIEFKEFLKALLFQTNEVASNTENLNANELYQYRKNLDYALHAFNYAFHNRFQSSYYSTEMGEYNLFYDGGIHLLISAFDGLTKVLSYFLGVKGMFIYVEAATAFSTSLYALRTNFYHIFHPEKLVSVIYAEIGNLLPSKFPELKNSIFKYHRYYHYDIKQKINDLLKKSYKGEKDELSKDQNLVPFLNETFFEHVFADMLSFKFLYLEDSELYSFWTWGYIYMTSSNYEIENSEYKFNEKVFIKQYVRHHLIEKFYNFNSKQYIDESLSNTFVKNEQEIKKFVGKLMKNEILKNWMVSVDKFLSEYFKVINGANIELYKKEKSERISHTIEQIKLGHVINSKCNDINSLFGHSQVVINSYLRVMKEQKGTSNRMILKRNKIGPSNNHLQPNGENWYFDPLGGLFIKNNDVKDEIFRNRNIFHYSLFSIALNYKRLFVTDIE